MASLPQVDRVKVRGMLKDRPPLVAMVFGLGLTGLLLLACSAQPVFVATDPHVAAVDTAVTVPFTTCQASTTWVRPSETEQAEHDWSRGRYAGVPIEKLRQFFQQDFYEYYGGNSEMGTAWPGLGLWTATEAYACDVEARERRLVWQLEVEIWSLYHAVERVVQSGDVYTVTVVPVTAGYQVVRFPTGDPLPAAGSQLPSTGFAPKRVHIVDRQGHALASFPAWSTEVPNDP